MGLVVDRFRIFGAAVARAVAGCAALLAVAPAQAQDAASVYSVARQYTPPSRVFSRPAASSYAPSFSYASRAAEPASRRISTTLDPTKDGAAALIGGNDSLSVGTAYCVRSCDGFFFPIAHASSGSSAAHESVCARACPGAETSVFTASAGSRGIEDAIGRSGRRYQALTTAFAFRTALDSACTCAAPKGPARNHSVLTDFTLRPGDMVMSAEGLKVFRGGSFPYDAEDFSKADNARLSGQERRWVQDAEASSMRGVSGGQLAPALQARIVNQVHAAKGKTAEAPVRQVTEAPALVQSDAVEGAAPAPDSRPAIRYVGPDRVTTDRR